MSTERTVRAILCVLFLAVHTLAAGQDPFHRSFTMEDGLPSNKVYRAIQDHEGFMWFATDNGVARFDGLEFTVLGLEDGLVDTEVIMIQEDLEHRIWFMGLNGRLAYWKDGRVFNERNDPRLKGIRAIAGWSTMAVDKEGGIWFGALSGELVRLDMAQGTHRYMGASNLKRNVVNDAAGEIITMSYGIFQLHGEKGPSLIASVGTRMHSTHIYPSGDPSKSPLVMIDGRLHEVTSTGVVPLTNGPALDPMVHRSAYRTPQGDVWLHRHDRGVDLAEYRMGGFQPPIHYFGDRTISMVYTDDAGNNWFCTTTHGVVLVTHDQRKNTIWLSGSGVSDAIMTSVGASQDRVWVGTDQGDILVYMNGVLSTLQVRLPRIRPGRVLRILDEPDGTMWFGTDYALLRWVPDAPQELEHVPVDILPRGSKSWIAVKALLRTRKGEVLTAGIGVQRLKRRNGLFARHGMPSSLPFRIRSLCEDKGGGLWAGAQNGIFSIVDEETIAHPLPDSLVSSEVVDMAPCGGDTLLLATSGNGLLLWSNDRVIQRIGSKEGLPSLNIRRMRLYGDTVWCATTAGVVALVLRDYSVVDSWRWSTEQGTPTNDIFDFVLNEGRLFMVSDKGLGVSGLQPEEARTSLGPLYMASVQINDSIIRFPKEDRWRSHRGDRFQLVVHALEFVHAPFVEYAYALGPSGTWRTCEKGQVVLDGLDDGVHTISVRARLPGGPWSDRLTTQLEVVPPWWARPWMIFGVGLVAIIGLALLLRRYERARYKKKLAAVQAQMVLNEERRRIAADVHDDLGADLSKLLLQVRRQGAAPDDHELRLSKGVIAAISKIDEIIWSLDPKRDSLEGSLNFIEQYAMELCEANGLAFRTIAQLPDGEIPLTAFERREVFLLFKEAIRNVVKHAAATTLSLHAALEGDVVVISISDDGIGMDPDHKSVGRNGSSNMRERASRLGGVLFVRSIEPKGTRVELHFPPKNHPNG
jgi:signal transduction histidine kinase/ligand-binding sensor domain-containing protein